VSDLNVRAEAVLRALREAGVKVAVENGDVTIDLEVQIWARPDKEVTEVSGRTLKRLCQRHHIRRERVFEIDREIDREEKLAAQGVPSITQIKATKRR
jgi:hypothetical protein